MAKNYLDNNNEFFNTTKRLNNKPKIILLVIIIIFSILIGYILHSAKKDSLVNINEIETKTDRLDNDEYVKNMADNKGYKKNNVSDSNESISDLENVSDEDYNLIFNNKVNSGTEKKSNNINKDIIDLINDNETIKPTYPPLPISSLDGVTINSANTINSKSEIVKLTPEQITNYKTNRFSELETALKSGTKIYENQTVNNPVQNTNNIQLASASSSTPSFKEQVDYIMSKTGSKDEKVPETPLFDGDFELKHRLQQARKGEIKTGFVIPGILITEINSSVQGTVIGQVRQNVYDTATGNDLLIPQGTKLIGEYASDVPYGKSRLFMSWKRLVFPNGDSLDLDTMPGADMAGRAGFSDKVNTHFWKIFGNSILFSLIIGGINITTSESIADLFLPVYSRDLAGSMGDALAVSLGETMSEMIKKNLNIAPEIKVRSGYLFNIMITKDIILPIYEEIDNKY